MKKDSTESRRHALARIGESVFAGILGDLAVRAGINAASDGDLWFEKTLHLGEIIEVPGFTGRDLLRLEARLDHDGQDYVIYLLRAIGMYKNGAQCAQLGQDLLVMSMALIKAAGLKFRIDTSQFDIHSLDKLDRS